MSRSMVFARRSSSQLGQNPKASNLGVGAWAQVTKMKPYGTFTTNRHPIVEELAASVKNHELSAIAFATSVLRSLGRQGVANP